MQQRKIGVLAQYLNSRHDIREFINTLASQYQVVVFLRPNDKHMASLLSEKVETRTIQAQVKRSIWNNILIVCYRLFGVLPVSQHNYFITEFFKLNNASLSFWTKSRETLLLQTSRFTPKFISYDAYLRMLKYKKQTPIDDIDEFLCFTQVYDDLFFAHILESGRKTKVYVYSWDHPCKMKTFSKRVSEYLVWNEGLKEDLNGLQCIETNKIRVFGATQLTYINEFLKQSKSIPAYYPFDYIYFACATGYPKLVRQEVSIILKTAKYLIEKHPFVRLVVRTYPFFGAEELYAPLKEQPNIVIDDYKSRFKNHSDALLIINDKLIKISQAKGLIHFGTTFGLEAAYFKAPVVLADIAGQFKVLHEFVHQYQNDKYLNLEYRNVAKSWEAYEQVISGIIEGHTDLQLYNPKVASSTALLSMNELAERL